MTHNNITSKEGTYTPIADLTGGATLADVVTTLNTILDVLRHAGLVEE